MGEGVPAELPDAIVAVAMRLASEVGEEGVTMQGIAGRLAIPVSTVYEHFESKAPVMQGIRLRGAAQLWHTMVGALAIADDVACLVEISRRYVQFARDNPWLYTILMQADSPVRDVLSSDQQPAFHQLETEARARFIARFGAPGRDSGASSRFLLRWWAGIHGLASLLIGGRMESHSSWIPIDDPTEFIEDYLAALPRLVLGGAAGQTHEPAASS